MEEHMEIKKTNKQKKAIDEVIPVKVVGLICNYLGAL